MRTNLWNWALHTEDGKYTTWSLCYVTQCIKVTCINNELEITSTYSTETVISFKMVKTVKYTLQHLES